MSDSHSDPFHHVRDFEYFEFPQFVHALIPESWAKLPEITAFGTKFSMTKYMVIEVLAALLTYFIFTGLARHIRNGSPASGRFWNFWEAIALYIRDNVVRSSISEPHAHGHDSHGGHSSFDHAHDGGAGHLAYAVSGNTSHVAAGDHSHTVSGVAYAVGHYSDRFLPFLWTIFFFILFNNLLGLVPSLGSPTATTSLTGVLAASVLIVVLQAGIGQYGFVGFFRSLCPPMDVPGAIGFFVGYLIWAIELIGFFIKHIVLAIRLFANLLAGHIVLGSFLGFIAVTADSNLWYVVTPASVLAQVAISMLELFVSFLQAYVFTLLASMAIGAAVNPH
jgi:F-type H+-transporting ATPase subunit a